MPKRMLPHPEKLTAKAGIRFAAANGGEMGSYGRKMMDFQPNGFQHAGVNSRGGMQVHAVRRETYDAVCGVEEEADGETSREVRKLVDPQRQFRQKMDAHELTHLPFRNWCELCLQAAAPEDPHRRADGHP